jgi:AcrR family transcriptional regulator
MTPTPQLQKSPWPTRDQRARQRETKRDAVLAVAVRLFNERGFRSTSLDDVASRLNVTKPTIYYYFSNKDEILFECVRIGLDSIREAASLPQNASGNGLARLKAVLRDYARVMTEDFGKCVVRTSDHELSADSRSKFRALKRQIDGTIRTIVEQGIADGSIAQGNPKIMTFMITGALNWIVHWHDSQGDMSAEEIALASVEVLLHGLTPRLGEVRE